MSQLLAENLVKSYRRRRVVNQLSLVVQPGEVVGLLGPNGAGKTTTFYMITGFIKPEAGKIFLGEKEITYLPMYKRARLGVGYLAQEPSVFRRLTVEQNVMAILETTDGSKQTRKQKLEQLLNELNISHLAKNKAYTLSGGERRRVEITRALVTEPKFMLLDEPFAGIDPIAVEDIQKIVARLKAKGLGILITDHNVRETLQITDRAYIIASGVIFRSGTPEALAGDSAVREVYLGHDFRLT